MCPDLKHKKRPELTLLMHAQSDEIWWHNRAKKNRFGLACPKTFITIIHCDKNTVCTYTVGDLAECEATSYKNRVIDTTAGC